MPRRVVADDSDMSSTGAAQVAPVVRRPRRAAAAAAAALNAPSPALPDSQSDGRNSRARRAAPRKNYSEQSRSSMKDDDVDVEMPAPKKTKRTKVVVDDELDAGDSDDEELEGASGESDDDEKDENDTASKSSADEAAEDDDDDDKPEPRLRIEKLLATERRSRADWLTHCAAMTTSKVLRGRRREILAFEDSSAPEGGADDIAAAAAAATHDDDDGNNKQLRRKRRRAEQLDPKKLRKDETRFLVKWAGSAFLHCSWEPMRSLKAYLSGDAAALARQIRKLEQSAAMMDDEELADMQTVDRIVAVKRSSSSSSSSSKKGSGELSECEEALVKWRSQGYEDATWELWRDVSALPGAAERLAAHEERNSASNRQNRGRVGVKDDGYSSAREFRNGRRLRSYQVEAVTWLSVNFQSGRNSILADEMGLGKTCQTVAFTHRLRNQFGRSGPFLIVAPLATLPHWQREFEAWTQLNCITYHGAAAGRARIREHEFFWPPAQQGAESGAKARRRARGAPLKGPGGLPKFEALVTNYETVLSDAEHLRGFKWELLVVDEAHRLKNSESKLTVCLRSRFNFAAALLLTGTPIQNSLPELWTLLNFIAPADFDSLERFKARFGEMRTAEEMDRFHDRLRPYMLRRIKSEVEPLPDREDTMIEVELTSVQKRFYRAIYERNSAYLLAGVEKGARVSLNNVAMELRKCCCHPYLIDGVEAKILADDPPPATATPEALAAAAEEQERQQGQQQQQQPQQGVAALALKRTRQAHVFHKLINASGKLILLDKLLPKLQREGHRVLIFSQMTRMLDILEDYLQFRALSYERIDGSVRGVDRQFAIDRFSAAKSQTFAFLLSTRGCGQGINLTAADTVIMYDGDWNPQNDVQALARCHRIGQTRKVMVYRLITRKTYEYTMFQRASMKLGLDHAVMAGITHEDLDAPLPASSTAAAGAAGAGDGQQQQPKMTKKEQDLETERLLKFGAYALTEAGEDEAETQRFVNADIDEILASRAKVMTSSREDNQLSKATFIAADNDTALDINDPDFWTKVVGLRAETHGLSGDEDDLEALAEQGGQRRRRRRNTKKARVNYAGNGFAALTKAGAFGDGDSEGGSESGSDAAGGQGGHGSDSDDDSEGRPGGSDRDEYGRPLWFKKHFYSLLAALQRFGYGKWPEVHAVVDGKWRGRFTEAETAAAARGFALFCLFRRQQRPPAAPKPGAAAGDTAAAAAADPSAEKTAAPAGDKKKAENGGDDVDDDENEGGEAADQDDQDDHMAAAKAAKSGADGVSARAAVEAADGDVTDFALVNAPAEALVTGALARLERMQAGTPIFTLVLDDLRSGEPWVVPDCLTTRHARAPLKLSGSAGAPADDDDADKGTQPPVSSSSSPEALEDAPAQQKKQQQQQQEEEDEPPQQQQERQQEQQQQPQQPRQESQQPLVDSDSDDSELEGAARAEHRRRKRGPAFSKELAERARRQADSYIRNLDKHACIRQIAREFVDPSTGAALPDRFPTINGAVPARWWTPKDDLLLLVGLDRYGWDARKSATTFERICSDPELDFTRRPPQKKEDASEGRAEGDEPAPADADGGGAAPAAAAAAAAGAAAEPSADDSERAPAAPEEDIVKSEPEPATVKIEPATEAAEAAASGGAAQPVGNGVAAQQLGDGDGWPSNVRLGVRAKRVTDFFLAMERRERKRKARSAAVAASRAARRGAGAAHPLAMSQQGNGGFGALSEYQARAALQSGAAGLQFGVGGDHRYPTSIGDQLTIMQRLQAAREALNAQQRLQQDIDHEQYTQQQSALAGLLAQRAEDQRNTWTATELKGLFRAALRHGLPSGRCAEPQWDLTWAQLGEIGGLRKKKSAAQVEARAKLMVTDAIQMRMASNLSGSVSSSSSASSPASALGAVAQGLVPERHAGVLGTAATARKFMERVTLLRELRGTVLAVPPDELLTVLKRLQVSLNGKKRTRAPGWWTPELDLAMLRGASRHGVGSFTAVDAVRADPELPFAALCGRTTEASEVRRRRPPSSSSAGTAKGMEGDGDDDDDDDVGGPEAAAAGTSLSSGAGDVEGSEGRAFLSVGLFSQRLKALIEGVVRARRPVLGQRHVVKNDGNKSSKRPRSSTSSSLSSKGSARDAGAAAPAAAPAAVASSEPPAKARKLKNASLDAYFSVQPKAAVALEDD